MENPTAVPADVGRNASQGIFHMYQAWQITRWDTPLSDLKSVAMVSLVDDGELSITFEAPRETGRPRWCVTFRTYPGYRNLLEEFRLELWSHLDSTNQRCGSTFTVANSPWIETLRTRESLFDTYYSRIKHYVLSTEDDVIEVLSPNAPRIDALGQTPTDEKAAGKSTVYYHPEDRAKIETEIPSLKRKEDA